jgi:predicted  nucleic acid-binding Zn-ribbon protein
MKFANSEKLAKMSKIKNPSSFITVDLKKYKTWLKVISKRFLMDDVEAAIKALEWGKNEFLNHGHSVTPSAMSKQLSPNGSQQQATSPANINSEVQLNAELSKMRIELEATRRRCNELQTNLDIQREGRATTERDLLTSRTVQTEQNAQLHADIRSLQQQLWQSKQEVEHLRAKEQQSQAQLSSSLLNVENLRQRLTLVNQEHATSLQRLQRKLDQALAERDSAVLEARQIKMNNGGDGSSSRRSNGIVDGSMSGDNVENDVDVDSLPRQVAQRLRQAAEANEELVRKLDLAESFARETKMLVDNLNMTKAALEQRDTQLQNIEAALQQALANPKTATHVHEIQAQTQTSFKHTNNYSQQQQHHPYGSSASTSPMSTTSTKGGDRRGIDLARRAEAVASNASNMLHLLTSKHSSLLSHVSDLRHQLDDAQERMIQMDVQHKKEVDGMEEAHKKILSRLADMSTEASGLSKAVKRSTSQAVEKAVSDMLHTLKKEKEKRKDAELKMKQYRNRVSEWENALNDANDRSNEYSKILNKYKLKYEKVKTVLHRAKARISKLESDRESLRSSVNSNRIREAQLAEQAATQAEIQVSIFFLFLFFFCVLAG